MKETFSLNSNFSLSDKNEDGIKEIEGFAIHGGEDFIVNGLFEVPASEMKNCAKTLKGAKLMKDHDHEHVDSIIGRVNQTEEAFDEKANMDGVYYKASLVYDDTNLGNKIDAGLIDATSIGFEFEPECSICGNPYFSDECEHFVWWDDMHLVCRDMSCFELSLVPFGADSNANVTSSTCTSMCGLDVDNIDKIKEKLSKQKEEFIMSKQDNNVQKLQDENLELSQQIKDLEAKLSQKEEEYKSQVEDLTLAHQEEILNLTQERDALKAQYDELSEEVAGFRAEAEAKAEQELAEKKAELTELATELHIEHTIEDIDDMDAAFIDRQIEQMKTISENLAKEADPKPGKFNSEQKQPHIKDSKERKQFASIGNFFHSKPSKGD